MYIDTLSELAYHVPLTQIDIPPAVYQYVCTHISFLLKSYMRYQREHEARNTD